MGPALGSVAGHILTTMCWGSPTGLAYSSNDPLTLLYEAEEEAESRPPPGSVVTLAGDPPAILAYSAPLTILGEAEMAEDSCPLGSVVTRAGNPPAILAY